MKHQKGKIKLATEEYRLLKNQMKAEFRAIRGGIEGGSLPDAALLHAFLEHSRQMITYSGAEYGEADYPAYRESCEALARACAAGDIAGAGVACGQVQACKKSCHKQWKP